LTGIAGQAALAAWVKSMPGRAAIPFATLPQRLYNVRTLYEGYRTGDPASLARAFDTRVFDWTRDTATGAVRAMTPAQMMAARLHDTAIDEMIAGFLGAPARKTVGFMGGHGVSRAAPSFRQIAGVARALRRRGFMIATGGGPGLMEAANFGAFMAPFGEVEFEAALETLRAAPVYENRNAWLAAAVAVRTRLLGRWNAGEPPESANLGVPTWVYGAEPPNLFATAIGKYFYNSLREDGLVTLANGGLVFGEGEAGTVQEVFQNATLNYYRAPAMRPTPMVFLGADYWNPGPAKDAPAGAPKRKPLFPLIEVLAAQAAAPFTAALLLTDDPAAIVDFIAGANEGGEGAGQRVADVRLGRTRRTAQRR